VETDSGLIFDPYAKVDAQCCTDIYRVDNNGVSEKVLSGIDKLPGYATLLGGPYSKSSIYIFSWSPDGRYIIFSASPWEWHPWGQFYLDTVRPDSGFQKLSTSFKVRFVSPDKTKAIGSECIENTCRFDVIDFNTLRTTPLFAEGPDTGKILPYGQRGMMMEAWESMRWLDNSTIEFFSISEPAHDELENCIWNAQYEADDPLIPCRQIFKENFSTLKHHVVDVSPTI
jgi:hypothetical protein